VKLREFWGKLRRDGWSYLHRKAREKGTYYRTKFLDSAIYPVLLRSYLAAKWPLPDYLRYHYHSKAHWRVFAAYKFKPFPGKITLIRARDRGIEKLGVREDPTLGWGSLALGGVEIVEVPTGHFDMIYEPYVGTFAKQLNAMLAEAREKSATVTAAG